jgi:diguanylate cyclase (GGDEF)-like protein
MWVDRMNWKGFRMSSDSQVNKRRSNFEMSMFSGYNSEEIIYESKTTLIVRATREKDQEQVVLKMLNSEYPAPDLLARFGLEYTIGRNLNIDGVVKMLTYEQFRNKPLIIMKDIGGSSLAQLLPLMDNRLPVRDFLILVLRITHILDLIHRQKIIHKDINPTNIIWNPKTNRVNIIDFGISTELSRETQTILNPEILEGTLAYMSPEQTGRMNRAMDYRTDLYSLGVVFYQLLTGVLPFDTKDPMELVHCHIARNPIPPHEFDPGIPPVLSAITMKLMSKMAEDRYQNAIGIRADLQRCLDDLMEKNTISDFVIGEEDLSDHFRIPQKLYGREKETSTLLNGFSRVSKGGLEMMLIVGYSGVGKSSLVQEIYKSIAKKRGLFISGKFDQFQHEIPYYSIIQAFKALVQYVLTENDSSIQIWKEAILKALKDDGQLLVDVIPELKLIIGLQKPVLQLAGNEAQKRFSRVFIRFLGVFCTKEHPLVLFLDDLHWADPASLQLIQSIMTQQKGHHLFLIGAYRDNEVDSTHPLMLAHDAIAKKKSASTHISNVTLQPLSYIDVCLILHETFDQEDESIIPLADLVYKKTGGNPFFLIQLLISLYEDGLINFSYIKGRWIWDLDQIGSITITENVADLLVDRINKLPETTQNLLLMASCLGTTFELATLVDISGKTPSIITSGLHEAIAEELIVPHDQANYYYSSTNGTTVEEQSKMFQYRFLHDRVQEAAYSKLTDEKRAVTHLKAGRLLLQKTSENSNSEQIFNTVNHLNFSAHLLTEQNEREHAGHLNLLAGMRAKNSTAYTAALEYFTKGIVLLTKNGWDDKYATMFQLHKERIECEFLCGNTEKSKELFDYAVGRVKNKQDSGLLYELMIRICHINYEYDLGIELGKKGLKLFDIEIPSNPAEYEKATAEIQAIINRDATGTKEILRLVDAPSMLDEDALICCGILHELWVCLFMSGHAQVLLPALILIRLSLRYGQSSITAVGCVFYALILSMQQEYDKAYAFGRLAMQLKDKYFDPLLAPKVHNTFCNFVNHYKHHIATNIPIYEQSFQYCVQSGEIWWGAWAASFIRTARLIKGDHLEQVYATGEKYREYICEAEFAPLVLVMEGQMATIANLMDKTGSRTSLDSNIFNEKENLATMAAMPFGLGLFWHYVYKSFVLYLNGEFKLALEASMLANDNKIHIPGLMMYPDHFFFNSLIIVSNWETFSDEERKKKSQLFTENLEQMDVWQSHCPANYSHRFQLMSAEFARVQGRDTEAMLFYDGAIELAGKYGYQHHEAVAHELAGRFYLERNHYYAAKGYLMEARYLYLKWGAARKVRYFDQTYPQLAFYSEELKTQETIATTSRSQALDFTSVMKASQAISVEIVLENLLRKLMTILIENAGAQKGFLMLEEGRGLVIRAKGNIASDQNIVLDEIGLGTIEPGDVLPVSIVNYVARTKKSVVLIDAENEGKFTQDEYIVKNSPRSILCSPLINQGKLGGLLYLENNLTPGAFTPDRIEVLTLLSTQAAIAIENATLYTTLEQKVENRTAELMNTNLVLQAEVTERKRAEKALKQANKELHHLASLDGLTKVANRRYFDEYLATEWKRMQREQLPISLVMCDIDYFKKYNDTYGHQKGDDCLKLVTLQMSKAVQRPADLVARYGGEEFILVLPNSDASAGCHIAETVQKNIKKLKIPHSQSPISAHLTVSIGIASVIPSDCFSIKELIYNADQALYLAKNKGRDTIVVFY